MVCTSEAQNDEITSLYPVPFPPSELNWSPCVEARDNLTLTSEDGALMPQTPHLGSIFRTSIVNYGWAQASMPRLTKMLDILAGMLTP